MKLKPMNTKSLCHWSALLLSLVAVGGSAAAATAAANYCDPFAGCKHSLRVSPSTVKAGQTVTLRGSVAGGCQTPGAVTIYSRAFKGVTAHRFAGVPAVSAKASAKGRFAARITLAKKLKSGSYRISGRCGGGNFGSTTLKVT
jgi:hypothetical protein